MHFRLSLTIVICLIRAVSNEVQPNNVLPPHGCGNYSPCKNPIVANNMYTCAPNNCACNAGSTGELCETFLDTCQGVTCTKPNSVCTPGFNEYTCECNAGFTGPNCEYELGNPCVDDPCYKGDCVFNSTTATYTCENCRGFVGPNCEFEDPCRGNPCVKGTCSPLFSGETYFCKCPSGYQGRNCEIQSLQYNGTMEKMGCFNYSSLLDDKKKWGVCNVENKNSQANCEACMKSLNKVYKYYALSGPVCLVSNTIVGLNATDASKIDENWNKCKEQCPNQPPFSKEKCAKQNEAFYLYRSPSSYLDDNTCDSTLCPNNGTCYPILDTDNNGYDCLCPKPYSVDCKREDDKCSPNPCLNGQCVPIYTYQKAKCICDEGFTGNKCQFTLSCDNSTCLNGGTCVDNNDGTHSCLCRENWKGDNCEELDTCQFDNDCVNGTCVNNSTLFHSSRICECDPGYELDRCDGDIDECLPQPCENTGNCTDLIANYLCTCPVGTSGRNCEINFDDCNVNNANPCRTEDKNATCIDGINSFTCNCSSDYTDVLCDLPIFIRDILISLYGEGNDYKSMIPLLKDLLENPTQIKDLVPFFIGMSSTDERLALSWDASDIFYWAALERKPKDFTRWNDVVLGNCFTFNHHNTSSYLYKLRGEGERAGLEVMLDVQSGENQPWYDTASILTFIHTKDEYIFSESVRYNAEPKSKNQFFVQDNRYSRLAGRYGVCVNSPDEVSAYYYEGLYTTDGCLRSCYQDMIKRECKCMDPRYPFPAGEISCELNNRTCIENATETNGDPTKWDSCVCPLPCNNQQYTVQWSKSVLPELIGNCNILTSTNPVCKKLRDIVYVNVFPADVNYRLYAENPSMDFNRFISNLGGLLGVLMGISIVSFIEIAILVIINYGYSNPPHSCKNFAPCTKPYKNLTYFGLKTFCDPKNCKCLEGTLGPACQDQLDWCSRKPCESLGDHFECINHINYTECVCKKPWTGRKCEIDSMTICATFPCVNNGTCVPINSTSFECKCSSKYLGSNCQYENKCLKKPCFNGGTCIPLYEGENYKCLCETNFIGRKCEHFYLPNITSIEKECNASTELYITQTLSLIPKAECICPAPFYGENCALTAALCQPDTCNFNGQCYYKISKSKGIPKVKCKCSEGYAGEYCQFGSACLNNVCKYGSTCIDQMNGTYSCSCLQYYKGKYCDELNICEYSIPCVHGKCKNIGQGVDVDYECVCDPGYTGKLCENEIDECEVIPCQHNGTCTDKFNDYECSCIKGTKGRNCEININDCILANGKNPCKSVDKAATCVDLIDSYKCVCSEKYMDVHCDLHVKLREILLPLQGSSHEDMRSLLNKLLSNPTQIKDMAPFIIGMHSYEARLNLSWETSDLLIWATFEHHPLDLESDFVRWNDVVLGNCFTFNHFNLSNTHYYLRSDGDRGGLELYLNTMSLESQPWYETSAINFFIHNKDEYIFSESVRYNAQPGGSTKLLISDKRYQRLSGNYGECVEYPDEVDAYYYDGLYTTDGCLRSCYQNMLKVECGCMDPRYPIPTNETSCIVNNIHCIENATLYAGDPSTWNSCVCPLPCTNQQYSVQWSRSLLSFPVTPYNYNKAIEDDVLVTIAMVSTEYQMFSEHPTMDVNRFISSLGGLLGVLMGISIISFIEISIFIFYIVYNFLSVVQRK